MVFVLWSSPDHALIKYRGPIQKNNQITPTYAMLKHKGNVRTPNIYKCYATIISFSLYGLHSVINVRSPCSRVFSVHIKLKCMSLNMFISLRLS